VETCLHTAVQVVGALGILLEPFLPETSQKIRQMLGLSEVALVWKDLLASELLHEGRQLAPPILLFEKIDNDLVQKQIAKLPKIRLEKTEPSEPAPMESVASEAPAVLAAPKATITYEDFEKIDIRTAKILKAEKIKGADKLLQLTIDTGVDTRTIVSGIALYYTPEEIIGKQVLVLINLAPRKLRGILSEGMILMAESPDGKLVFVQPSADIINGAVVK
jgi:methionyl-tRNA synthetase